jgi:hypothetical protein
MGSLQVFLFFPELRLGSCYEHSNRLSTNDQQLWYDAVLLPVLTETVGSSNMMQHYPVSAHVAGLDATALATETFARKESAREQLLKYALQPQHLDLLWTRLQERIAENPGFHRFANAALFVHAKNTKLEHMDESLPSVYGRWERSWSHVADPQFYSRDRTYVDLGKQVTSEDSGLPYDAIPADHEAEVFLWKRCCLEAYARTRIHTLADGKRAKGSPKCTTYPWATMRDTTGQTLFAAPHGQESVDGLIYSQFYALIKTPFDTSKAYVFDNDSLENLALDPGYVRSLQQQGGAVTFSKAVCEWAYLHSKKRAHANLVDNRWKSYGIREEHRMSLTMMVEIGEQWREWDLYDDSIDDARPPRPYCVVPTKDLLAFLYAQINKYCFLFEHTLAHTAQTFSLPETMVMVVALRALRFCYSSSMLCRESLLYKDRWEQARGPQTVVKEGLGMRETMERCGLGWFLPKFNWSTLRLAPPHGENMLVGNLLMHSEYKRRWQAVKDLRDVFVRFNQAEGWYGRYQVKEKPGLLRKWLEYLHVLTMEQFDADVWKAMLAAHKRSPELSPEAVTQGGPVAYCWKSMRELFLVDGVRCPPHVVTGNKGRFKQLGDLLPFLFEWDDGQERAGWGYKPYRILLQKSFELVERRLGHDMANQWLLAFGHLIHLTHWILPYPTNTAFLQHTKTNQNRGLYPRTMWFSSVYAHPDHVDCDFPTARVGTLMRLFWRARQQMGGERHAEWGTSDLLTQSGKQGLLQRDREYWVAARKSPGSKGFQAVWEVGAAPKLKMLGQIQKKSLDELEELIAGFAQDQGEHHKNRAVDAGVRPSGRRDVRTFFKRCRRGSKQRGGQGHGCSPSHKAWRDRAACGRGWCFS